MIYFKCYVLRKNPDRNRLSVPFFDVLGDKLDGPSDETVFTFFPSHSRCVFLPKGSKTETRDTFCNPITCNLSFQYE